MHYTLEGREIPTHADDPDLLEAVTDEPIALLPISWEAMECLYDYDRTGYGDCGHAFTPSEFNIAAGVARGWTAEQIVDAVLDGDDWQDNTDWLAQQETEDRELCGDVALWKAWKSGWRGRAISYVSAEMAGRCLVCGGDDEGNTCCP